MSIIRVGLAETKNYAEGYEAIFGKKKKPAKKAGGKSKSQAKAKSKKKGK